MTSLRRKTRNTKPDAIRVKPLILMRECQKELMIRSEETDLVIQVSRLLYFRWISVMFNSNRISVGLLLRTFRLSLFFSFVYSLVLSPD